MTFGMDMDTEVVCVEKSQSEEFQGWQRHKRKIYDVKKDTKNVNTKGTKIYLFIVHYTVSMAW